MEQLTQLEQAAVKHFPIETHFTVSEMAKAIKDRKNFIAGANWLKEQFKEIIPSINEALIVCGNESQDDIVERIETQIDNFINL